MRRLFVYICTFVIFLNMVAAPLPVLAAELPEGVTDYSELVPDENGKYWIYFEIVSDSLELTDGSIHNCDLQIYADVTNFYTSYGHAGFSVQTETYGQYYRLNSIPFIPKGNGYGVYSAFVVNGVIDDIVYENFEVNGTNFIGGFVSALAFNNNNYNVWVSGNSLDAFKYVPCYDGISFSSSDDYLYWNYVQEKPNIIVPAPQEPVFEYAYNDAYYTSTASGVDVILRYPYETASDYYNQSNQLDDIPLMNIDGTKLCETIIFVRLTCNVGGTVTSTYWAPIGSIGYVNSAMGWGDELLYNLVPELYEGLTDANIWVQSWVLGNSWSGCDGMTYMHFDLTELPDFLANCGIEVANSPVTLLTMEVSAQNYHTELEQYSDLVYSAYDFNSQSVGSGSVTAPGTNITGITGVTVNNTIVTGNTSTLPTVNNTVNQGDTNVTVNVNNNIPGNMNVNLNVSANGDKDLGIFGWLADKMDDATRTVQDIDSGFNGLIDAINGFVGDFPGMFSWIMNGLPEPYVIWMEIGISVGVVIVILKVCKIW